MALLAKLNSALLRKKFRGLYRRFQPFTMVPEHAFVDNLSIASRVANLPGCIVECGVWRGGMSAAIASILGPHRQYCLFDSFQGLPDAKEIDGPAALAWQKAVDSPWFHDNCTAPASSAREAMKLAGVSRVQIFEGWFHETLPAFTPSEPIAFLRLDADWYDSTMICLETLMPHLAPGGIVVLDDYYTWDGCSRAVHDYLSKYSCVDRIHVEGCVGYIKKVHPQETPAP